MSHDFCSGVEVVAVVVTSSSKSSSWRSQRLSPGTASGAHLLRMYPGGLAT